MKKSVKIIIIVLISVVAVTAALYFSGPYIYHMLAISAAHNVKEASTVKGDYKLCSELAEDEETGVMYMSFHIYDKSGKEVIYECNEGWRTFDLKFIGFEKDTNNIYVDSADTGCVLYYFEDGTWMPRDLFERNVEPDPEHCVFNRLHD